MRKDLREEIKKLKKEKKAVILAHNYQTPPIQDIADFVGDSFELAKISRDLEERLIIFCGVRFMAETTKILSPEKKVLLPSDTAGCPLAEMIKERDILLLKEKYPQAWVVSYVNSSAGIKALSDVCCTSANAVKVVKNVPASKIIFVPDKNLGWWVKKNVPQKEIVLVEGYCYVHQGLSLQDIERFRLLYPEAEILVHPEAPSSVLEKADFVLSTSGMIERAKVSLNNKFIIGTEEGLIYRLKKESPYKEFYSLGIPRICQDMKKITLETLFNSLENEVFEIHLKKEVINKAKKALERMFEYS
ncbi:MAG: quinolinate synthase [Candidatus Omnitrophica bacterium 4484_70.2]|nr:MAG: quinolinate synthase [Candidatus Omnitrophica bacterium 4484_70.2]